MHFKDQLFLASQYLAPHHLVSRLMGLAADCRTPAVKNWMISRFVRRYGVNMTEALLEDPLAYPTFNQFFTRALKADARPLDTEPQGILCPADGAISQLGRIEQGRVFQAKGHSYGLTALLGGDAHRADPFVDGEFATVYLSPRDYHRVHMPCAGTLREMVHVPGRLFSVNPLTATHVPELFARNERVVCIFDTEFGPMALVLVGAMIVASIETVWAGLVTPHKRQVRSTRYDAASRAPIHLEKGAEMGRFLLGSTVIVLFGPDRVRWTDTPSVRGPVRMGELMALPA
ncbi:archaetidylserine decarboxylase [Bordetella sp. 02P26C-1]|uniref:archaetidylserine decarboxylase n=1 Tax=Bordetella sp. 02P26C-1 TaxID=2683195 RepID=UPI001355D051|nr:archaetidylserine decarboxylase [Bordetella sp. 02P26C-1]MVW79819.1 phosphatidylserine decarboxylase [Bordetella sp. 02P26C-1]